MSNREIDVEYVILAHKMWLYNRIGKFLSRCEEVPKKYMEQL
jgi:hypothetical protein